MSYLVTVTFDLKNETSEVYKAIDEALSQLGLSRKIGDSAGKSYELPANTYAGKFEGEKVGTVRDDIATRIESAFQRVGAKGRMYVTVGSPWAWGIRYSP